MEELMYVCGKFHTWDDLKILGVPALEVGGIGGSKAAGFLLAYDSQEAMEAEHGKGVPFIQIRRKQPKA